MASSILQQYWIRQEKQRSFSPSINLTIDEQSDRITNKSESFLLKDFQSNSNSLCSPSSTTSLTIKEFCPAEKEEEEEKNSWKRFVDHHSSFPIVRSPFFQ
jgi:hypothetical protein